MSTLTAMDVAIHEAAHCITALALGVTVYEVALSRAQNGGFCGTCAVSTSNDAAVRFAVARAGEIACQNAGLPPSNDDAREQRSALSLAAARDGNVVGAETRGDMLARHILSQNRPLIQCLAKRLRSRRRLGPDDLADIALRVQR